MSMQYHSSPSWNRLETVFQGGQADRTPTLGGWIASPAHICAITGLTIEEYWADPRRASIGAYRILGVDGLLDVYVPPTREDYRCVDANSYARAVSELSFEQALEYIGSLPSADKIERDFELEVEYARFAGELRARQAVCGDMVYMPAQWAAGAHAGWYWELGYENFFLIVGSHPDQARKLMEIGGARGRCRSRLIARAVQEGLYPHAALLGEDICTQRGPMVSPRFLEEHYAPSLRYGLEPLLEVGCKPVWHSDGDVRPLLDMLFDCGVQGLQGFQPECGMTIEHVAQKRTREGNPLLIFGPIAVTTELPTCTPAEIRAKVRHAVEVCKGNADLVLFASNTINPDVPVDNVFALYSGLAGNGVGG